MDLVCILDTETTGLDPAQGAKCIEVGCIVYSIRHRAMVEAFSSLIHSDGNDAEHVNHIPVGLLRQSSGMDAEYVWGETGVRAGGCEAVLAHNADFDRQWVPDTFPDKVPWIDTCGDVTWPLEQRPGSSLVSLCLDHGIGVVDPHRALGDCFMLARLMTRVAELGHDVSELLARGLRPKATFEAKIPYEDRDIAKDAGFRWEKDKKRWIRKMAIDDAAKLPFRVVRLA